jgi:hypothetical protein
VGFEPTLTIGEAFISSEEYINDSLFFIDEGIATAFPAKPSMYHIWDWETKAYILSAEQLNLAKLEKLKLVNRVRANLSLEPIPYDNKTLDADTQAQSNINGKLQEIFARGAKNTPLTSGEMFWKDADNVIHSWGSQENYKLWLQGLVIAISSRNTELYATAWTKKAEVEALTDINDILNYDTNSNWS